MMARELILILLSLASLTIAQNETFDYVIAGAGTTGLLLAVILSENPNITVCVLEAGGDGRLESNITDPERRGRQHRIHHSIVTDIYRINPKYRV